ncbi:putative membrane protein [Thermosporothrix hazakensis]|jgi:putative membrane protein|uniref:SHOCT domain-containing protein n=2 Tax=Thermosporothrix TaxID=768650 RepID=A0A455SHN7_9CHLR|nr:SHOCT domain-containing protein [Thermosporothrix hazakensis]PZW27922.1 putative membrane protein [Thermosporothrix hazakensis]BBH86851.1 hypothetical protein KTC_16020 [Thermosporothrix sp. COM3]GCE51147.1 hypothetical protein KTH_60160 [Thermosporothrix hazakensis]
MHCGFGPWAFMPFIWFLFLAGLVGFLIFRAAIRNRAAFFNMQQNHPARVSALEILRQRYARGEIDGTTFDIMRERLEGSIHPKE